MKRPKRIETVVIDDGDAFFPDATRGRGRLPDDAEADAEEFVAQATSAEDVGADARDEWVDEELGGPFLELRIDPELVRLARTEDASRDDEDLLF
jgi:hypothetical protein